MKSHENTIEKCQNQDSVDTGQWLRSSDSIKNEEQWDISVYLVQNQCDSHIQKKQGKHPNFLHYQMAKGYTLKTSQENSQL